MSALEKARLFDPDAPRDGFYVQFNPNTLEYSAGMSRQTYKGAAERNGQGRAGVPELQSTPLAEPQGAALSVKLFYHTYVSPTSFTDVRTGIHRIRAFLPGTAEEAQAKSPRITFAWGTMTHTGTLESFSVAYQMFAHDGTPVQAEVSITIRGEDPDVCSAAANQWPGGALETQLQQSGGDPASGVPDWLFQT